MMLLLLVNTDSMIKYSNNLFEQYNKSKGQERLIEIKISLVILLHKYFGMNVQYTQKYHFNNFNILVY